MTRVQHGAIRIGNKATYFWNIVVLAESFKFRIEFVHSILMRVISKLRHFLGQLE